MTSRHSIIRIPFQDLADQVDKTQLKPFQERSQAILPQALAWIGSYWPLAKATSGRYGLYESFKLLVQHQQEGRLQYEDTKVELDWLRGFVKFLTHSPRGDILHSRMQQSKQTGWRYAANVPLILSAFKQFRNIPYEQWEWSQLLDPKLPQAALFLDRDMQEVVRYRFGEQYQFTQPELLQFREETNLKKRALTAITTVVGISDPDFKSLPRILKLMLLQVWIYHPSIRHPLAITNLENFDEEQTPLVSSEVERWEEPDFWSGSTEKVRVATERDMWLQTEDREYKKSLELSNSRLERIEAKSASDIPWDV